MKVTHLLDPVKWMQGEYTIPRRASLPAHTKSWKAAWNKLQDPWNRAYVEALATFALGGLRSSGISPHFNEFYGAYCAISDVYHYNINEDYQSFRNSHWFWKGKEQGMYDLSVINSAIPHMSAPDEIIADILTKPDDIEDEESDHESDDETGDESGDEGHDADDEASGEASDEASDEASGEEDAEDAEQLAEDANIEDVNENASLRSTSMTNKTFDNEDAHTYTDIDEQYIVYANIPEFPVMLILTEANENTMDFLVDSKTHTCVPGSAAWERMWSAWIFQVIAALTVMQKVLGMTHNDLHTNNIVWTTTTLEFLYYKSADGTVWKVPTYGKIFRLIDFGRSIFTVNNNIIVSDDFRPENDADGQYCFEPLSSPSRKDDIVEPNPSFDLSRLAISLFEHLFPTKPEEVKGGEILSEEEGLLVRETVSPLYNSLWSWMVDDDDKNILMKPNGEERFPDFDLYTHIAAKIHNAIPAEQIHKAPFSQFKTLDKVEKAYSLFV
jgi:hypothetical protein